LGVEQGCSEPTVSLHGVGPPLDLVGAVGDHAIDCLDAIGGPEASLQEREHSKSMEGERFFQPFFEAAKCRLV